MRKVVLILMIGLLATAMVCAQGGAEKPAPVEQKQETLSGTLTIWSYLSQKSRATELENLARGFEAANPGVKVEIAIAPWSGALDKIVASIMAGNPPDLTIVGQGYPQTLAETGGLVELSDFVNEIGGKDAFLGSSLSILGSSQDGGVYSVPLYITPTVLYYRESLIKKAGITKLPTTWDEYYEMCKAVTDPANNVYGFAIPLGDNHGTKTIWGFMQSNGVNLVNVDKNGKWYVDLEGEKFDALKEVYAFLYKMVRDCAPEGTLSYKQAQLRELVAQGTIMSRLDTPEIYPIVNKMNPDAMSDLKYIRMPAARSNKSYMGWVGWSIPSAGHTDLAKAFLRYCYSDNRLAAFYASYPHAMFPATKSLFNSSDYVSKLPDELQAFFPDMALEILSNSNAIVMANGPFPMAGEVEQKTMLGDPLVKMVTDGISADQAAQMLKKSLQSLF